MSSIAGTILKLVHKRSIVRQPATVACVLVASDVNPCEAFHQRMKSTINSSHFNNLRRRQP